MIATDGCAGWREGGVAQHFFFFFLLAAWVWFISARIQRTPFIPPKLAPCCTPIKHSCVLLSGTSFNLSVMKLNALSWPSCMMRKPQDKYRKTWSQTVSRSPTWMPFSLLRDQCQRSNMLPIGNAVLRKAVLDRNHSRMHGGAAGLPSFPPTPARSVWSERCSSRHSCFHPLPCCHWWFCWTSSSTH